MSNNASSNNPSLGSPGPGPEPGPGPGGGGCGGNINIGNDVVNNGGPGGQNCNGNNSSNNNINNSNINNSSGGYNSNVNNIISNNDLTATVATNTATTAATATKTAATRGLLHNNQQQLQQQYQQQQQQQLLQQHNQQIEQLLQQHKQQQMELINSNYNHPNPSLNSPTQNTFSLNKNEEFQFVKPPECPVFRPNDEEFKNPLSYISKIRPIAEKYGICKILPPKTWTPPFTVDVDEFRFTPRVQRLNELEAKTRVKLNFLDQIAKFWELQGSSLKIPMVERRALDLYTLHRCVQEEGGMEIITRERKWSKIASRMHYPAGKSVGAILKGHYERILHPFDIFTSGKAVDLKLETEVDDQDYKPHGIVSRQQITPPNTTTAKRSKRFATSAAGKDSACGLTSHSCNTPNSTTYPNIRTEIKKESNDEDVKMIDPKDYRRFQQINGNCKSVCNTKNSRSRMASGGNGSYLNNKKKIKEADPLAKYVCHICNRGDAEEAMLLCDGCDDSYHTFCLIPPLNDIPKGDWRCPKCVVEEVSKPQEAFGFEQAQREYTLQQFGEMADQFKADYFNMSVHLVPTDLVEREFWRIVSSIDEDVTVEYGADLHTMDHGSGFPTRTSLHLHSRDQEYAESSWNLNNLPLLEESILGHINADISGMKIPWMYVGMCFATFCWHNEDHWSYSINYLHWGEPKTWYGVPGSKAEAFEKTMKSAAPELFQSQPDLLHQLVTIMNPNILMNSGVPVYRTDQCAGEFVITFPRAYHAGFNQGYNFAEAVNFAPADWMKMGRECINHYSALRRFCVFSHDELVCKMSLNPDKLNLGIATACYLDMAEMVDSEKKLRKSLLDWGVTKAEREAFELIPDDERQCESCKTTCFLSAVTCPCTKSIVCLRHYSELCDCPADRHTLRYRYTLDELPLMLKKLKVKAESFENWLSKVRDVLDPNTPTTITLQELQELAQEAESKKFPISVLLERLNSAVLEAEKCVTVIQQLDINKMRTRTRNSNESAKYKLTLDELEMFVQEIDNLCCVIQEGQSVRELQQYGKDYVEAANKILLQPINKVKEDNLERLIEEGLYLCIELPEIKTLKYKLQQVNWYNRVREFRDAHVKLSVAELQKFLKEGLSITPDTVIEKELVDIQEIILMIEDWEAVAQKCFESGTQHELPEIELLLERAEEIEGELPSKPALKDAVKKAKEWLQTVENLQANENYPYFHTLENVVNRGKNIPFQLEELKRMEEHLESARIWKDFTSRTFLKKQTSFTLMDVLSPRAEAVMIGSKLKKKPLEEQFTEEMSPVQMVNAFKNAEEKEIRDMKELRKINMEKNPLEDKYCTCKRKFQGNMYHCQLCKDWFHEGCVPAPKNTVKTRPNAVNSLPASSEASSTGTPCTPPPTSASSYSSVLQLNIKEKEREVKYLCQSCMRSRRPRLDIILQLLVSLQRLPIRLPEGEALQCLAERAMNWQDRVTSLSTDSQKLNDSATKINQRPCTTSQKSLNKKKGHETHKSSEGTNENSDSFSENENCGLGEAEGTKEEETATTAAATNNNSKKTSSSAPATKIEHAYSFQFSNISSLPSTSSGSGGAFNKTGINSSTIGINTNTNSPTTLKTDMPSIQLSRQAREILEDLMMEGDLLEVSIDETLHLWKILNAAKPSISDLTYIQNQYKLAPSSSDILVSNGKKRKPDDGQQHINKRLSKSKLVSDTSSTTTATTTTTSTTSTTATIASAVTITPTPENLNNNTAAAAANKVKRGRKMKFTNIKTDNMNECSTEVTTPTTTTTKTLTNTGRGSPNAGSGNEGKKIGGGIPSENKKRRRTGGGKKTHQDLSSSAAAASLTSDDEDECSAPNCARPSGREVDWVQCDGGCNNWFHMFCEGLSKHQIKPDVDYICKKCKKNQKNSIASTTTTAGIDNSASTSAPGTTGISATSSNSTNDNSNTTASQSSTSISVYAEASATPASIITTASTSTASSLAVSSTTGTKSSQRRSTSSSSVSTESVLPLTTTTVSAPLQSTSTTSSPSPIVLTALNTNSNSSQEVSSSTIEKTLNILQF